VKDRIANRVYLEVPWDRVRLCPTREVLRLAMTGVGLTRPTAHEVGWASVDRMYRDVDSAVAKYLGRRAGKLRALYAYEDGALESFRAARELGIVRIFHLPVPAWRTMRRLLAEEAELVPDWATTMTGLADSPEKLARKDEEIALADRIVVASSFTRQSLDNESGAKAPVTVARYGAPIPLVKEPCTRGRDEPISIIYAGQLSQRKGLAYLLRALRRLDVPWRLSLAGSFVAGVPLELKTILEDQRCTWVGALSHPELLRRLTKAHVLVFPSIVEGFGMVVSEALAAGLPVITTPHTAGPDILTDGVDGFIVPIRDPDAIAQRITDLANDEDRRMAMSTAALNTASALSWRGYEDLVAGLVREVAV
jgi:glycosyltransferase involved in cell wall biosynthesis